MCTYIKKNFPHVAVAQTASVTFRTGSPKMAQNEQVCVHQNCPTGRKFSKIFFHHLYTGWTVVVTYVFSVASDGATTECQI